VTDAPASPKAGRLATPGWLDGRLVLGVLLVLVSVVVGARVLASADRTQLVWTATRDLAPGTALSAADLEPAEVRLFAAGSRYLAAPDQGFVGYVVERGIARGELVPVEALGAPGSRIDLRFVSVPVLPGRYPSDLARGTRVDVWATADPDAAAATGGEAGAPAAAGSRLVLSDVAVHLAPDSGGALSAGTAERAVVLSVRPQDVGELVAAMTAGRIDLVRVPESRETRGNLAGSEAPAGGSG